MYELKFHDAKKEIPTRYKVFAWMASGYVTDLMHINGHYNCHFNGDGTLNTDNEMTDVLYWADIPSLEEVKKAMEGENDA